MAKKVVTASADASWAKLFPLQNISLMQAQFFDNRDKANGVKGQSDFAVKLFVYHRRWKINLRENNADWWRVVQLIDPRKIKKWADGKHAINEMTDQQLAVYHTVVDGALHMEKSGDYDLVRMGHIASPPGKQYFVGQFVLFTKDKENEIQFAIFRDEETLMIPVEKWKPAKNRGRYPKKGNAKFAAIYDPSDILGRQEKAAEAVTAMVEGKPTSEREPAPMSPEMALRDFLSN